MKYILCYGDSNTYGYNAENCGRFPWGVRWTSLLQEAMGSDYRVIEEGLCGRTTVWDDPIERLPGGSKDLKTCLRSHAPLDLVILMLGTNDLKVRFGLSALDIALGAETLVKMIQEHFKANDQEVPKILLVSPIEVGERITEHPYSDAMGGMTAVSRSRQFAELYRRAAKRCGCEFMAASEYAKAGSIDWFHLNAEEHGKLANAITEKVKKIFLEQSLYNHLKTYV